MSPFTPKPDLNPLPPVRIETCPDCSYSLEGLPTAGRCPECGLDYDEDTHVLRAITRGTSGMSKTRVMLWIVVGISAWFGFSFAPQVFFMYGISFGVLGNTFVFAAWSSLVIYLLVTSKHHRGQKRAEHFILCAGGFGPCAVQSGSNTPHDADLTRWSEVDAFHFKRIGANFQRLRIGSTASHRASKQIKNVAVDVGVRCTPSEAQALARFIQERMNQGPDQSLNAHQSDLDSPYYRNFE